MPRSLKSEALGSRDRDAARLSAGPPSSASGTAARAAAVTGVYVCETYVSEHEPSRDRAGVVGTAESLCRGSAGIVGQSNVRAVPPATSTPAPRSRTSPVFAARPCPGWRLSPWCYGCGAKYDIECSIVIRERQMTNEHAGSIRSLLEMLNGSSMHPGPSPRPVPCHP